MVELRPATRVVVATTSRWAPRLTSTTGSSSKINKRQNRAPATSVLDFPAAKVSKPGRLPWRQPQELKVLEGKLHYRLGRDLRLALSEDDHTMPRKDMPELAPEKLPAFSPHWRAEITGGWYAPSAGDCYHPVYKRVRETGWSEWGLHWTSDWIGARARHAGESLRHFVLDDGLHFGMPEAAMGRELLRIPPKTGVILVALLGPGREMTVDWEPSPDVQRVQGAMWGRFLRHLYNGRKHEVVFTPSFIGGWGDADPTSADERDTRMAQFEARCGCSRVADLTPKDLGVAAPQLLPWSYTCCAKLRLDAALAESGGPGATGYIAWRGYRGIVKDWSRLRPRTLRLDAALDYSLFLFQVLWHGEGMAILTRHLSPDEVGRAQQAPEVRNLVAAIRESAMAPR
jgi:hypothetical protein